MFCGSTGQTRLNTQRRRSPTQGPLPTFTAIEPLSSTDLKSRLTRATLGTRSSKNELVTFVPKTFLFTPADAPPPYTSTSTPSTPKFPAPRSNSSPHLPVSPPSSPYGGPCRMSAQAQPHSASSGDSDNDPDDDDRIIHWSRSTGNLKAVGAGLRARVFGIGPSPRHRDRPKTICTTPGEVGAGETETEVDEPVSTSSLS